MVMSSFGSVWMLIQCKVYAILIAGHARRAQLVQKLCRVGLRGRRGKGGDRHETGLENHEHDIRWHFSSRPTHSRTGSG